MGGIAKQAYVIDFKGVGFFMIEMRPQKTPSGAFLDQAVTCSAAASSVEVTQACKSLPAAALL